jgi:hypothetical protein
MVLALVLFCAPLAPLAAQDFALQGLRGGRLVEADLARGTTICIVWASWSPRSRGVAERVNGISGRWGGRARVVVVNFQEDRQTVERFLDGKGVSADVFLDESGAFSKKYSVATLPGLLVVKDGTVAYRGKLPDDPDSVIAPLLG